MLALLELEGISSIDSSIKVHTSKSSSKAEGVLCRISIDAVYICVC